MVSPMDRRFRIIVGYGRHLAARRADAVGGLGGGAAEAERRVHKYPHRA